MENENKEVIVYAGGTWDLFHIGHLNILKKAKSLGTKLIIGVNTDELVELNKKVTPIIPLKDRIEIIKNCKFVDEVVIQETYLKPEHMLNLNVNIIVAGSDWENKHLDSVEWLKKNTNIQMVYFPYTSGISSTEIKKKLAKFMDLNLQGSLGVIPQKEDVDIKE